MTGLPTVDSDRFWREGYLLVKQVFSRDEVSEYRRRILQLAGVPDGPSQPAQGELISKRDLLSYDELRDVLLDDRVLHTVRELLDSPLVYFGDSSFHVGVGERGWHKDNCIPDRWDHSAADWNGRYSLVRVGVYLQDHSRNSGGLGIRVGSHQAFWGAKPPLPQPIRTRMARHYGNPILVNSEPGDVVVWTLRTTHTGNSVRSRLLPRRKLHPVVEGALPAWLRIDEPCVRVAAFATFGARSDHLDRYIQYLKTRDYMWRLWERFAPSEETRKLADARGLELLEAPQPERAVAVAPT